MADDTRKTMWCEYTYLGNGYIFIAKQQQLWKIGEKSPQSQQLDAIFIYFRIDVAEHTNSHSAIFNRSLLIVWYFCLTCEQNVFCYDFGSYFSSSFFLPFLFGSILPFVFLWHFSFQFDQLAIFVEFILLWQIVTWSRFVLFLTCYQIPMESILLHQVNFLLFSSFVPNVHHGNGYNMSK